MPRRKLQYQLGTANISLMKQGGETVDEYEFEPRDEPYGVVEISEYLTG